MIAPLGDRPLAQALISPSRGSVTAGLPQRRRTFLVEALSPGRLPISPPAPMIRHDKIGGLFFPRIWQTPSADTRGGIWPRAEWS